VLRIRWFDPDTDDPSTPVDWRVASVILATIFLNFYFEDTQGSWLSPFWPLPLYAVLVGAIALVLTTLFFVGPALATRFAGWPLFRVVEDSVGSIPARGVRLCVPLFLALWIAAMIGRLAWWWESRFPFALAAVLTAYLLATGQQSLRTTAKLALFSNKLGVALLIAALIRVRDGWEVLPGGFKIPAGEAGLSVWIGLSELAFYVTPLALVAVNFGYRSRSRRDLVLSAFMGVALPLFLVVFLVGVITRVTHASSFYQPSLRPSVDMALWGHAARSALPPRFMIAVMTTFGAVRFAGRSLMDTAVICRLGNWRGGLMLVCAIGLISRCSLRSYADAFTTTLDWSARCLGVTSAVITVDLITRKPRFEQPKRIDWVGFISLLAGLAIPLCVPLGQAYSAHGTWSYPLLLPSYLAGFLVCLCGRTLSRR
jgi:hypothetical protein